MITAVFNSLFPVFNARRRACWARLGVEDRRLLKTARWAPAQPREVSPMSPV